MPLIKNAVTTLTQGVSQQAESQRFPSQATEQINGYSSPIKGLVKRPPTKYISKIDVDVANINTTFAHTINRDSSEQYLLSVDKLTKRSVTAVDESANTITVGSSIDANTPVRFMTEDSGGQLPQGIESGKTYYTKTTGTTVTLSKTSGGAVLGLGQVNVTSLSIESFRHTDGRWVDGVIVIGFAAGHGFVAGDEIKIDGLLGEAATVMKNGTSYALRALSADHMGRVDGSGNAIAVAANTFILGKVGTGGEGELSRNLGYHTDDQWEFDGDDDGWNAFGALHWSFYNDSSGTPVLMTGGSGDNICNRIRYNTADNTEFGSGAALDGWNANLTQIQAGDLIRLGTIRNLDKAMRVKVTSISGPHNDHLTPTGTASYDIHFDYIKLTDLWDTDEGTSFSGTNPPWVFIAYWGDTTTNQPLSYNPRQLLSTDVTPAKIGAKSISTTSYGNFSLVTGGIKVFDVNAKTEKPVNIEGGLDYLAQATNPAEDLEAVTVADYTFLVNKKVTVKRKGDIKYHRSNEAFISCRTANYDKRYTIKIGAGVSKEYGAAGDTSSFDFEGKFDGKNIPVARLRAKKSTSDLNGYQVRLLQNWDYTGKAYAYPMAGDEDNRKNLYADALPTGKGSDSNQYAAVEYDKVQKIINIWVNFDWADRNDDLSNIVPTYRTSVEHLKSFIEGTEMGREWELVELLENGNVNTGTPRASTLWFDKLHLGPKGKDIKLTRFFGLGAPSPIHEWTMGPDETIGSVSLTGGNTYQELTIIYGEHRHIAYAGYKSPSAGANFIRGERTDGGKFVDTTAASFSGTQIEDGEFFYKTPKWTGNKDQEAIGTERIAEILGSNCKITTSSGTTTYTTQSGVANTTNGYARRANGLKLSKIYTTSTANNCKEEGLGLKYTTNGNFINKLSHSSATVTDSSRIGNAPSNWRVVQDGYTLAIKHPTNDPFSIQVSDDAGGKAMALTYFEVDETSDLPNICRHGHVVKVVGKAREEADDYYLRFEADVEDATQLRHGRWVECLGYDQPYKLDKETMPLGIVSEADGSFTVRPLDWSHKDAGDDESNPFPSFVDNTISDIFLFRNRLGFLSGENIIFSEAGEYFNFFRTTVAALVDSAPIDLTASTNKVSKLHSAIPWNERLIIFSDQTQFTLDADPYLSAKTVTLSPSNEIVNLDTVKPTVSGDSVFYGFQRTGFSGVGQLGVSRSDAELIEAGDATAHVPKYISKTLRKLVAAPNEDVVCGITSDTTSATLYVHKYHLDNQNQKIQAAWFKYTFGGTEDYITDISFIDNTLYMLIRRKIATDTHVMCLESLTFEDELKDDGMDYEVLLDSRVENLNISYNSTTGVTTVSLPTNYPMTTAHRLVTEDSVIKTPANITSTTFTVDVNLTGKKFFVGLPYTFEYTFSQPFLKSQKVTETGRYQLHRGLLEYANARSFSVAVTHNAHLATNFHNTLQNTFSTDAVQNLLEGTAELQAGKFKFPIQERNDRLGMKLTNSSPYPADFLSIDYEARVFSRGSRWSS